MKRNQISSGLVLATGLSCLLVSAAFGAADWPDLSKPARLIGGGEHDAAVVVGAENYVFVAKVPGARHNAEDWQAYLTDTLKVPSDRVALLRDNEATLEKMRRFAAQAAAQVGAGGTLWFVFIGHGAPSKDGKDGLLVGTDAQQDPDGLYARSLPRSELLSLLSKGKQVKTVVLIDACFSGRSSSGENLVAGLQPLIVMRGGLGDADSRTILLTAAKSDQFAGPLPKSAQMRPAFSYLVLGALRGWAADSKNRISASGIIDFARRALALDKGRTQTPELTMGSADIVVGRGSEVGPDLAELDRDGDDQKRLQEEIIKGEPIELATYSHQEESSAHDKSVYEALMPILKLMGDAKDVGKDKAAEVELGKFIEKYPDFPDGYFLRATLSFLVLHEKNYATTLADLGKAIQLHSSSKKYASSYESEAPMYGLRAKVKKVQGNFNEAVGDLERAVVLSNYNANEVFSISGVSPDKPSSGDVWTKSDLDQIISRDPSGAKGYMLRGFFYSFFTAFGERYYPLAINDYKRALALNPKLSVAYYLLGEMYMRGALMTKQAIQSDVYKNKSYRAAIQAFDKATELNPRFAVAYGASGDAHLSLNEYKLAIRDFDKFIALDPHYAGYYDDRGAANSSLGQYYDAIEDFSHAIENRKPGDSNRYSSFQNRAKAYMKVGDFDRAIEDFNSAIQLQLQSVLFIMDIHGFRAIYAEYDGVSDEALVKYIWKKFYPNFKLEDIEKQFLKGSDGKSLTSPMLADLYLGRGDAYLGVGRYMKALQEYDRVARWYPSYADGVDRWRLISSDSAVQRYLDRKTVDSSQAGVLKFWIKTVSAKTPDNVVNYAVNCSAKTIDQISSADYGADGNVINSGGDEGWRSVIPATVGELFYKGMCSGLGGVTR